MDKEANKIIGHKDIEIDLVAESIDKSKILIGECKWSAPDYAGRLLNVLKNKARQLPFYNGQRLQYVLFLREKPLDLDSIAHPDLHILYPEDICGLLI